MPDTIRNRPAVLTLLADNTIGGISPQDLRDAVVSMFGVYGGISVADAAVVQAAVTTTPVVYVPWDTNGPSAGTTPDHANDRITVLHDGVYIAFLQASFSGTNNSTWSFHFRVGGVEQAFGFQRKLSAAGDVGSAFSVGLMTLSANDIVTVFVESANAGGDSLTTVFSQLGIVKVA